MRLTNDPFVDFGKKWLWNLTVIYIGSREYAYEHNLHTLETLDEMLCPEDPYPECFECGGLARQGVVDVTDAGLEDYNVEACGVICLSCARELGWITKLDEVDRYPKSAMAVLHRSPVGGEIILRELLDSGRSAGYSKREWAKLNPYKRAREVVSAYNSSLKEGEHARRLLSVKPIAGADHKAIHQRLVGWE